jgi:hypothetical protein
MKLDPGIHIVKHLVFFGKSGVTPDRCGACPAGGEEAAATNTVFCPL